MRGEHESILRAKHLLSLYEMIEKTIDRIKMDGTLHNVAPELLRARREILSEYNELYLLLKVKYLINRQDFNQLNLRHIELNEEVDNTN